MDIEKIHKLREQCLVRFPLRINQYNHYIEDANGCVMAVVYGTAGNAAPYLVEAANALPELLDEMEMLRKENQEMVREGLAADVEIAKENMRLSEEVERLRKEVRLLNEKINVIKWSIVEAVGGVSYDGQTTNTPHCLQRLRILAEKGEALSLACSELADVMEVCPAELEWCESRECPSNRGKCWEDYFLEKVRGE